MNHRQKLVQKQFLNNEEAVIKRLKQVYNQSLKDINQNIEDLMSRNDSDQQYVIYQVEYQKALKRQINGILDTMETEQFKTVSEYLTKCYDEGFVGTMFDLQGQGIPLVLPIDQEQLVRAVQLDSKISNGLYSRLGEDVSMLKKHITAQISRGISTGMSFEQVAQQISFKMVGTYNSPGGSLAKAMRIARTEGHRIQIQAGMDACYRAKEKGADIVKQWDATLDSSTRESHQQVDGEIRELDEKFSNGLMFPGDPSGGAAEVVNCRCALLQRARWALKEKVDPDTGEVTWTDDSFTKMNAGELVDFSSVDDYNEFKKQYWSKVKEQKVYSVDYDCDLAKKFGSDYYDALQERIQNSPHQELSQVWKQYESSIQVGDANYGGHEYCMGDRIYVNGARDAKGSNWQSPYQVTFHESGHAIDSLARKHPSVQNAPWGARHYSSAYKDGLFPKTIEEEVNDLVKAKDKELKALFKAHKNDVEWLHDNHFVSDWAYDFYKKNGSLPYGEIKYSKSYAYSAIEREINALPKMARADLSDILEGASKGKIQCGFGHGKSYWSKRTYGGVADGLATEAFAEMTDSTFTNPESLETIKKYLPKSHAVFEEMIKNLL